MIVSAISSVARKTFAILVSLLFTLSPISYAASFGSPTGFAVNIQLPTIFPGYNYNSFEELQKAVQNLNNDQTMNFLTRPTLICTKEGFIINKTFESESKPQASKNIYQFVCLYFSNQSRDVNLKLEKPFASFDTSTFLGLVASDNTAVKADRTSNDKVTLNITTSDEYNDRVVFSLYFSTDMENARLSYDIRDAKTIAVKDIDEFGVMLDQVHALETAMLSKKLYELETGYEAIFRYNITNIQTTDAGARVLLQNLQQSDIVQLLMPETQKNITTNAGVYQIYGYEGLVYVNKDNQNVATAEIKLMIEQGRALSPEPVNQIISSDTTMNTAANANNTMTGAAASRQVMLQQMPDIFGQVATALQTFWESLMVRLGAGGMSGIGGKVNINTLEPGMYFASEYRLSNAIEQILRESNQKTMKLGDLLSRFDDINRKNELESYGLLPEDMEYLFKNNLFRSVDNSPEDVLTRVATRFSYDPYSKSFGFIMITQNGKKIVEVVYSGFSILEGTEVKNIPDMITEIRESGVDKITKNMNAYEELIRNEKEISDETRDNELETLKSLLKTITLMEYDMRFVQELSNFNRLITADDVLYRIESDIKELSESGLLPKDATERYEALKTLIDPELRSKASDALKDYARDKMNGLEIADENIRYRIVDGKLEAMSINNGIWVRADKDGVVQFPKEGEIPGGGLPPDIAEQANDKMKFIQAMEAVIELGEKIRNVEMWDGKVRDLGAIKDESKSWLEEGFRNGLKEPVPFKTDIYTMQISRSLNGKIQLDVLTPLGLMAIEGNVDFNANDYPALFDNSESKLKWETLNNELKSREELIEDLLGISEEEIREASRIRIEEIKRDAKIESQAVEIKRTVIEAISFPGGMDIDIIKDKIRGIVGQDVPVSIQKINNVVDGMMITIGKNNIYLLDPTNPDPESRFLPYADFVNKAYSPPEAAGLLPYPGGPGPVDMRDLRRFAQQVQVLTQVETSRQWSLHFLDETSLAPDVKSMLGSMTSGQLRKLMTDKELLLADKGALLRLINTKFDTKTGEMISGQVTAVPVSIDVVNERLITFKGTDVVAKEYMVYYDYRGYYVTYETSKKNGIMTTKKTSGPDIEEIDGKLFLNGEEIRGAKLVHEYTEFPINDASGIEIGKKMRHSFYVLTPRGKIKFKDLPEQLAQRWGRELEAQAYYLGRNNAIDTVIDMTGNLPTDSRGVDFIVMDTSSLGELNQLAESLKIILYGDIHTHGGGSAPFETFTDVMGNKNQLGDNVYGTETPIRQVYSPKYPDKVLLRYNDGTVEELPNPGVVTVVPDLKKIKNYISKQGISAGVATDQGLDTRLVTNPEDIGTDGGEGTLIDSYVTIKAKSGALIKIIPDVVGFKTEYPGATFGALKDFTPFSATVGINKAGTEKTLTEKPPIETPAELSSEKITTEAETKLQQLDEEINKINEETKQLDAEKEAFEEQRKIMEENLKDITPDRFDEIISKIEENSAKIKEILNEAEKIFDINKEHFLEEDIIDFQDAEKSFYKSMENLNKMLQDSVELQKLAKGTALEPYVEKVTYEQADAILTFSRTEQQKLVLDTPDGRLTISKPDFIGRLLGNKLNVDFISSEQKPEYGLIANIRRIMSGIGRTTQEATFSIAQWADKTFSGKYEYDSRTGSMIYIDNFAKRMGENPINWGQILDIMAKISGKTPPEIDSVIEYSLGVSKTTEEAISMIDAAISPGIGSGSTYSIKAIMNGDPSVEKVFKLALGWKDRVRYAELSVIAGRIISDYDLPETRKADLFVALTEGETYFASLPSGERLTVDRTPDGNIIRISLENEQVDKILLGVEPVKVESEIKTPEQITREAQGAEIESIMRGEGIQAAEELIARKGEINPVESLEDATRKFAEKKVGDVSKEIERMETGASENDISMLDSVKGALQKAKEELKAGKGKILDSVKSLGSAYEAAGRVKGRAGEKISSALRAASDAVAGAVKTNSNRILTTNDAGEVSAIVNMDNGKPDILYLEAFDPKKIDVDLSKGDSIRDVLKAFNKNEVRVVKLENGETVVIKGIGDGKASYNFVKGGEIGEGGILDAFHPDTLSSKLTPEEKARLEKGETLKDLGKETLFDLLKEHQKKSEPTKQIESKRAEAFVSRWDVIFIASAYWETTASGGTPAQGLRAMGYTATLLVPLKVPVVAQSIGTAMKNQNIINAAEALGKYVTIGFAGYIIVSDVISSTPAQGTQTQMIVGPVSGLLSGATTVSLLYGPGAIGINPALGLAVLTAKSVVSPFIQEASYQSSLADIGLRSGGSLGYEIKNIFVETLRTFGASNTPGYAETINSKTSEALYAGLFAQASSAITRTASSQMGAGVYNQLQEAARKALAEASTYNYDSLGRAVLSSSEAKLPDNAKITVEQIVKYTTAETGSGCRECAGITVTKNVVGYKATIETRNPDGTMTRVTFDVNPQGDMIPTKYEQYKYVESQKSETGRSHYELVASADANTIAYKGRIDTISDLLYECDSVQDVLDLARRISDMTGQSMSDVLDDFMPVAEGSAEIGTGPTFRESLRDEISPQAGDAKLLGMTKEALDITKQVDWDKIYKENIENAYVRAYAADINRDGILIPEEMNNWNHGIFDMNNNGKIDSDETTPLTAVERKMMREEGFRQLNTNDRDIYNKMNEPAIAMREQALSLGPLADANGDGKIDSNELYAYNKLARELGESTLGRDAADLYNNLNQANTQTAVSRTPVVTTKDISYYTKDPKTGESQKVMVHITRTETPMPDGSVAVNIVRTDDRNNVLSATSFRVAPGQTGNTPIETTYSNADGSSTTFTTVGTTTTKVEFTTQVGVKAAFSYNPATSQWTNTQTGQPATSEDLIALYNAKVDVGQLTGIGGAFIGSLISGLLDMESADAVAKANDIIQAMNAQRSPGAAGAMSIPDNANIVGMSPFEITYKIGGAEFTIGLEPSAQDMRNFIDSMNANNGYGMWDITGDGRPDVLFGSGASHIDAGGNVVKDQERYMGSDGKWHTPDWCKGHGCGDACPQGTGC